MDDGLLAIWNSIDAGIKFNVEKRELYLARVKVGNHNSQQARNTQQVVPERKRARVEDREEMGNFFARHRSRRDRFHWT